MNILDNILALIVGFFLLRGLARGLVAELTSIAGLVLGFYAAKNYRDMALPLVQRVMDDPQYNAVAAYALVFVATLLAVGVVAAVLRRFLRLVMLSFADHLFGGAIGFAKGALLAAAALGALTMVMPEASFLHRSMLRPKLSPVADIMASFLPTDLKASYDRGEAIVSGRQHSPAEPQAPAQSLPAPPAAGR